MGKPSKIKRNLSAELASALLLCIAPGDLGQHQDEAGGMGFRVFGF